MLMNPSSSEKKGIIGIVAALKQSGIKLNVQYTDREWAKEQGGRWNADLKKWVLPYEKALKVDANRWDVSIRYAYQLCKEDSLTVCSLSCEEVNLKMDKTHWCCNAFTGGNSWTHTSYCL